MYSLVSPNGNYQLNNKNNKNKNNNIKKTNYEIPGILDNPPVRRTLLDNRATSEQLNSNLINDISKQQF